MPNVKRRFADDDPSSGDDDEEEEEPQYYRGGGKGFRMPGGKGMGKQLRPPPQQDSSDEDDDDEEEEKEAEEEDDAPTRVIHRGGGKQLRPAGGKQLRPPPQQDDESEDDHDDDKDEEEEEEPTPIRPVARGGGKALMRMQLPEDDDDSDDDDDDDDDEEEEQQDEPVQPPAVAGVQSVPVPRGGGKQLRPLAADEEEDDDEDDDDDEYEPVQPVNVGGVGGGKQLRPPPTGGKQLRPPPGGKALQPPSANNEQEEEVNQEPVQPMGGGKQLRMPRGGKQLRAPSIHDDEVDDDDDDEDFEEKPIAAPEEADASEDSEEEVKMPATKPPVRGGKQLRRPAVKDDSDDDDEYKDDMEIDSEEDEDEDDGKDIKKPAPAPATRTTRGRAAKQQAAVVDDVEESSEDESGDDEMEMDMETFDTQRLVKDEEDQKYLDSLPEIEREAILADRFEKRKAEMDMKKALRESKKREREGKASSKQGDAKKRKAATSKKTSAKKATEEEGDEALAKSLSAKRESGRNKDASGSKAQKAKALAALREERKKVVRKEDSDSESDFGDDDEDSDEDYGDEEVVVKPWQQQASRRTSSRLDQALSDDEDDDVKEENEEVAALEAGRAIVEADLEDYQKITLPRRRLGRWCNEPYFKEAVRNCFVKLFIGENDQGKRCYRLCKIVDIKSNKSYQLPAVKNQKPVTTDKMLTLKFGKNQRDFPISLVSDAKVDEADMKQYVDATKGNRERPLGKKEANKMRRQQDKLVSNYVYTTEDIETNLRNRKKKGETAANLALERTRAAIAVQGARAALKDATYQLTNAKQAGNLDEIREYEGAVKVAETVLNEKLAEEHIVKDRVQDRKMRLVGRTKDQKWAKVNKRALEINQKVDRGEMSPKKDSKENSGAKQTFNPYARRKVKPKILWEVGQDDENKQGEAPQEGDGGKGKTPESHLNGDKVMDCGNTAPALIHEPQHNGLSQPHQFAIDEEVLAQSSSLATGISGVGGGPKKTSMTNRVRRGLSLAEYQERKSAGIL